MPTARQQEIMRIKTQIVELEKRLRELEEEERR